MPFSQRSAVPLFNKYNINIILHAYFNCICYKVEPVFQVRTVYYGSSFMGHSTSEDMVENVTWSIKGLSRKILVKISMDGPKVNLTFKSIRYKSPGRW